MHDGNSAANSTNKDRALLVTVFQKYMSSHSLFVSTHVTIHFKFRERKRKAFGYQWPVLFVR
jgi:hypothetical protein